jgi:hypothetical protein
VSPSPGAACEAFARASGASKCAALAGRAWPSLVLHHMSTLYFGTIRGTVPQEWVQRSSGDGAPCHGRKRRAALDTPSITS